MNCSELRQRIVDPASGSVGGHAVVVEHLHACASCRALARTFAEVEKLFFSIEAGTPPADFDDLHRRRLKQPRSPLSALVPNRALLAGTAAVLALAALAFFLWPRSPSKAPGTAGSRGAGREGRGAAERAEPPDILAVRSTPIALGFTPIPEEERNLALSLEDSNFLGFTQALETLGPFFPAALPPAPRSKGPASPADEAQRLTEWQDAPSAERSRWREADAAFRSLGAADQDRLRGRWQALASFSPEEKAGLRRLAGRIAELDPRKRARLFTDLQALAQAPPAERRLRWRALAFSRTLTGQEVESGEKLLLLF